MLRQLLVRGFLLAVVSAQVHAQSLPVSFEVASIKPNTSSGAPLAGGAGGPSIGVRGKHFVASAPLRDIIRYAYQLEPYQALEGGPRWLDDRFDINAVIPENVTAVDAQRLMLRTLLAERFRLLVRAITREQTVYELVVARRDGRLGPALQPSTTDCSASQRVMSAADYQKLGKPICDIVVQPFRARMQGSARTMADLASLLSRVPVLGAPVLDRTGMTGPFDFELTYAPERAGADTPRGLSDPPSLFVAIEEQLGLRLQRTRGGVDVLVIERLEPLAKE